MRKTLLSFFSICLLLTFVSCPSSVSLSSQKDLTSFTFTASKNNSLSQDAAGAISGTGITLNVPAGTDVTTLIADFVSTGESVTVNTIAQVSGTTANDFTSPLTYQVIAEDGSTQNYLVTVIFYMVTGLMPVDGSATGESSAELSWDTVDTATGYEVQLSSSESTVASAVLESCTAPAYTPSSPPAGNSWYWRVRAVDADGAITDWSPIASLTLNWGTSPVTLSSPASGTTTNDTTPSLQWQAIDGADSYEIQFGADTTTNMESGDPLSITDTSYQFSAALSNETEYFWRVRAVATDAVTDNTLYSDYSVVRSFTVSWGSSGPADGIQSAAELAAIGITAPLNGSYEITMDIDLSGYSNWTPIGSQSAPFTGTMNGNGYVISGLSIYHPDSSYRGLFGWIETGAVLENIVLENVSIDAGSWGHIGGLVGHNQGGSISNCSVTGDVITAGGVVGLLAGFNSGDVSNCTTSGTVESLSDTAHIGGLFGRGDTSYTVAGMTISNCETSATVTGGKYAGGLIGSISSYRENKTVSITGCTATGSVSGVEYVGGLIGWASVNLDTAGITISDSHAHGDVSGSGSYGHTGGLIGVMYRHWEDTTDSSVITVSSCSASGSVQGTKYSGGLVGRNGYASPPGSPVGYQYHGCTIENSYATGNVAASEERAGGLIGESRVYSVISGCFALGNISGTIHVAGLIGLLEGYSTVSNCFARGNVSGTKSLGGLIGPIGTVTTLSNSYSTGSIVYTEDVHIGGLVAQTDHFEGAAACFYDRETSGQSGSNTGITPMYTTEMRTLSTFTDAGWDFTGESSNGTADVWSIDTSRAVNDGYPYLSAIPPQ